MDYNFVAATNIDPGDLSTVYLSWDFDFQFLKPGDWPILDDPEIFVSKMSVTSLENSKRYSQYDLGRIHIHTVGYKPRLVSKMLSDTALPRQKDHTVFMVFSGAMSVGSFCRARAVLQITFMTGNK